MKNILFIIVGLLALVSCSAPIPQQKIEETVPTIVLSQDTTNTDTVITKIQTKDIAQIEISNIGIHIEDNYTTYDRLGEVKELSIKIAGDSITHISINNSLVVGESSPNNVFYTRMLDDNKVIVLEGATLDYVARMYDTSVGALIACNRIKNPNHIAAGTVLTIPKCSNCD